MGSRPPTPASCPIVLDRKEPGRELEPLQGPDHGLSLGQTGEVSGLLWSHIPPQTWGNGRVRHLSSAVPLDRNGTPSQCPRPRPNLASLKQTLPKPQALLPSQFISPHPAPSKSLRSSLQSPCCPASESEGPSSVPGFLSPSQRPHVRSQGGVQVLRSTSIPALGKHSGRASARRKPCLQSSGEQARGN